VSAYLLRKSVTNKWIRTKFSITGRSKAELVVRALDCIVAQPNLLSVLVDDVEVEDSRVAWRNEDFRSQLEWAKRELYNGFRMRLIFFPGYLNGGSISSATIKYLFSITAHNKTTLVIRAIDQIVANRELLEILHAHEAGQSDAVEAGISRANDAEFERHNRDMARRQLARDQEAIKDTCDSPEYASYQYCGDISFEICCDRLVAYAHATGNGALEKFVCAACARWDTRGTMHPIRYSLAEIPNRHRLVPIDPHYDHILFDGLLLHPNGMYSEGSQVHLCLECFRCLYRDRQPTFALARGFWVGLIPSELRSLTFPEKILIALAIPRSYIIKLQPKSDNARHLPFDQRNDALIGNVCSLAMPHERIQAMLNGELSNHLPHHPRILADVISIAFVGVGKCPPSYLRGYFNVSRARVHLALCWLRMHNPEYIEVVIDTNALDALPVDDLPCELVVRDDVDAALVSAAAAEGAGYVPDKSSLETNDVERSEFTGVTSATGAYLCMFSYHSVS
jgi:hypothetical protein